MTAPTQTREQIRAEAVDEFNEFFQTALMGCEMRNPVNDFDVTAMLRLLSVIREPDNPKEDVEKAREISRKLRSTL